MKNISHMFAPFQKMRGEKEIALFFFASENANAPFFEKVCEKDKRREIFDYSPPFCSAEHSERHEPWRVLPPF